MTLQNRTLFCGNFPELQDKFITEITRQRKLDPLAPLCVVVNSHLVGLALQRELARSGCSHANIHFWMVEELASELAHVLLKQQGLRSLSGVMKDALMERAIDLCGTLCYFDRIRTRSGFRRAAWSTLDGLRSAGITPDMLKNVHAHLTNSSVAVLRKKLADLIAIWNRLEAGMLEYRYADNLTVLELAAQAERTLGDNDPLVIYGLAELSELEKRFVHVLLGEREVTAYLPYRGARAQDWVKPLYEVFRVWGFREQLLDVKQASNAALARVQLGLFEEITPQEEALKDDDASLKIVSAPNRSREAEDVVRKTLYSPQTDETPQRRTGVLLRDGEYYTDLLRSEFEQAGVKGYFHQCQTLGQTPTGRSLLLLASLLDEKFRRAEVMEFLLASPVKWPQSLADPLPAIPATEWNQFALLAGIVNGRDAWTERLTRLRNQMLVERERGGEDDDEYSHRSERLESVEAMIRYMNFLFDRIAGINRLVTWRERVAALWDLLCECAEAGEHEAAVAEALRNLNDLDDLHSPLTADNLQLRLGGALAKSSRRTDRFQVNEPTVIPMSLAVGLLFDEALIPGVVEKEIPRPVPADPLLLDDERETLNRILGRKDVSVPLHSREREREMFLFHATVTSARKRTVFFYPRHDETNSRERLASTYLLKVVEAATARTADYAALESFVSSTPQGERIPISRLRQGGARETVTPFQYHEARLGAALESRSSAPLLYLIAEHPFFARAVEAERMRNVERRFTRYDGRIEDQALAVRLRRWSESRWPSFSPSLLEQYARCPFRFFVGRTLEIEPLDEPPEVQRISALDRHHILRDILGLFCRQEQKSGRLPLTADALDDLRVLAREYFSDFARRSNAGVYLFWEIDKRRILKTLTDYVTQEIAEASEYVPEHVHTGFTLPIDGDEALTFTGRLDRVDVRPDGHARLISYRTGKGPGRDAASALHLPIYRLAVETTFGLSADSANDVYIAAEPKIKKIEYAAKTWEAERESVLHTARTLRRRIGEGEFVPTPSDDVCRSCPARTACGTGRFTAVWKREQDAIARAEERP
jgi:ATP-dependent helicase/nuclease subunit B